MFSILKHTLSSMIWPKCLDDMLGNALNDQLSDSDLSARITLFITV